MPSFLALPIRSEEHTSELQSLRHLVCRLLLEQNKHHTEDVVGVGFSVYVGDARMIQDDSAMGCLLIPARGFVGGVLFFLNDGAPPEIYPFPLHDPLPL